MKKHSRQSAMALTVAVIGVATIVLVAAPRTARADLLAAYVQGYGGMSSTDTAAGASRGEPSLAIGAQVGARVLGLELYGDYTSLDRGAAVERGILGLRLGFGLSNKTRLELRVGGGAIAEQGGALSNTTSPPVPAPNRAGVVARAGVNLETRLMPTLFAGIGVNGEVFTLSPVSSLATGTTGWQEGSDILATLHLKFEIGI